ncbi:hypothetical protein L202_06379 [Cryptococcus amylolentus CBS 6039]|uniref:Uncharacterized protein n=1 Tax=Cryptococcus amylolentus CBS 6039 TaxID=1295533 RepID=A0A1E3HFR2_9TREE|nr:hypothetical protein L202_06379 [Cryptococcus amylolentus CBS 6039]ODN75180.1 hypothetical protein L202_06379 [Cryptococcus amylolentus CBS 6039]
MSLSRSSTSGITTPASGGYTAYAFTHTLNAKSRYNNTPDLNSRAASMASVTGNPGETWGSGLWAPPGSAWDFSRASEMQSRQRVLDAIRDERRREAAGYASSKPSEEK